MDLAMLDINITYPESNDIRSLLSHLDPQLAAFPASVWWPVLSRLFKSAMLISDQHHPKPNHGQGVFKIEAGGMPYGLERYDNAWLHSGSSLRYDDSSDLGDAMYLYHSHEYLGPVTESDPLVNLRLVYAAHQLPRGMDFASLVGPLRNDHKVDTYLIPHESALIYDDHDVVFGLSGTGGRVCRGLQAFLQNLNPRTEGFTLWQLCLLIPSKIIHYLTGSAECAQTDKKCAQASDEKRENNSIASSIACLKEALGRSYGPIPGAEQESVFTVESCSLGTIMGAIRFIIDIFLSHDEICESCDEYYQGGQPSMIPKRMQLSRRILNKTVRMDRRVPIAYILRPEMHSCLKDMQTRRYHLQFLLNITQARELAGERAAMVRGFGVPKEVVICISDEPAPPQDGLISRKDEVRVCDVGGNDPWRIEAAVVEIVIWMATVGLGDWSIEIYIPERTAARLRSSGEASERDGKGFRYSIKTPSAGEQSSCSGMRLEPAEEESTLLIHSLSESKGIQRAVNTILVATYAVNDNVL
ncbi:hypothetical protein BGZ54_006359 [Gamsiella multidivaricata]|nr:hypothetical protein BGZ54_006359 [Gamsiella multidivaricata]